MKKTLALLTLSLAAGASFAEGPLDYPADTFKSTKTRAEVRAEAIAARDAGQLQVGEVELPSPALKSTKTRAQVKAELAEAARTGNIVVNSELGMTERELYPHRYQ